MKKAGKVKYITCQLQTSDTELIKVISFSPDKSASLRAAMENKSPIKLKKFEFNEHFKNIVIKNNTAIIKLQEPLPFQLADISQTSISTIESLQTTTPQQLVNIKATVKNISGTKHVKMESGTLNTSSATLVDPTGSITAVFWEEWVNCVELNKTYTFTNFRVKRNNYTNEIYVNTAKEGFKLEQSPDFEEKLADAEPTVLDMTTKEAKINVIGIKTISSYFSCTACGKKGDESGKLLICQACKLTQKPKNKNWYAKLFVENVATNDNFYLIIFHQELVKLFQVIQKNLHNGLTEDDIKAILLDVHDLNITYNIADGKLLQINVKE